MGISTRLFLLLAVVFGVSARVAASGLPRDLETLHEKMALKVKPMVWIITGDSITQGAKWLGHERSYPELLQERIRWELNRRRDLIINSGISGERSAGLLADWDWRVVHLKPDIVSIMIGMNDCVAGPAGRDSFDQNVRLLVERVRKIGAIPILHSTNPIDSENPEAQTRHDLAAYNQIIAQVAQSMSVIFVDHWKHWTHAKPSPAALRNWLADPIHPNASGHRQMAIEFFRAIGNDDPASVSLQP
jgi:lysophospholipase L1-like esterase